MWNTDFSHVKLVMNIIKWYIYIYSLNVGGRGESGGLKVGRLLTDTLQKRQNPKRHSWKTNSWKKISLKTNSKKANCWKINSCKTNGRKDNLRKDKNLKDNLPKGKILKCKLQKELFIFYSKLVHVFWSIVSRPQVCAAPAASMGCGEGWGLRLALGGHALWKENFVSFKVRRILFSVKPYFVYAVWATDNFVKILKGRNSKHVFQINDVLK